MTIFNILSSFTLIASILFAQPSAAQTPPSIIEYNNYSPFFKAVHDGYLTKVKTFIEQGIDLEQRDGAGRTALHIATFQSEDEIFENLVKAGSNVNAFEYSQYDPVTIAAVADDPKMLRLILSLGGDPKNTTSLYDGTALIAAAHLGHVEVVKILIEAGSNLDHINNLHWTALLEAVILGDGSANYIAIVKDLLEHGANKAIADRQGVTPLMHARQAGYAEIEKLLK